MVFNDKFNLIIVLFMGIILTLNNYSDGAHLMNLSENQRACGRQLADLLHVVCQGRMNKIRTKRAEFIIMDDYNSNDNDNMMIDDEYDIQNHLGENTFLTKLSGGGNTGVLYPRVRRSWLGISDECCKKSCSYLTLKSYCS
ncbi:probable insulin-like peptide 5 [Condylostylus longicornis]|uniref:probable insulin-like peptide 5 n=1 Tax=Condylostylus longicornis TaxID=2530218 RepID=UPI00244DD647|nr:probable insulin-like peptide 5 [Condylostylus longicornis]